MHQGESALFKIISIKHILERELQGEHQGLFVANKKKQPKAATVLPW